MSCTSCSTSTGGKPGGCKSNGGCSTGGCNRMNVHDWLANLPFSDPESSCRIMEISFNQGSRKDFYRNNSLHLFDKGEIVDLVGGIEDIDKNVISAVGDASERFIEDRLRILRTFRFASRNQSEISDSTIDAIVKDKRLRNISKIDDVSQERIVEEFIKAVDWSSNHNKLDSLHYYLESLEKYGMFDEMFPDLDINITDIDTFNKAVDDFNVMVKKTNATNNECNKNRSVLLNQWNNTVETFLDKHTPKYR